MSNIAKSFQEKLEEIERRIKEVETRLPAHSVKPPIMHELFDLENERDRILEKMREQGADGPSDIRKAEG